MFLLFLELAALFAGQILKLLVTGNTPNIISKSPNTSALEALSNRTVISNTKYRNAWFLARHRQTCSLNIHP